MTPKKSTNYICGSHSSPWLKTKEFSATTKINITDPMKNVNKKIGGTEGIRTLTVSGLGRTPPTNWATVPFISGGLATNHHYYFYIKGP